MLVGAALAGAFGNTGKSVQGDGKMLWKEIVRSLSFNLRDPYLRVLFALLASNGNWMLVLNETSLPLSDRMVMAFRFLNDTDLVTYIKKWTDKSVKLGRIDGLLLTGWTKLGVDLVANYVDKTGDIQTAALLLSIKPMVSDPRIDFWASRYLQLTKLP